MIKYSGTTIVGMANTIMAIDTSNVIMDLDERCRILADLINCPVPGSDPTYLVKMAHKLLARTYADTPNRLSLVDAIENIRTKGMSRIPYVITDFTELSQEGQFEPTNIPRSKRPFINYRP